MFEKQKRLLKIIIVISVFLFSFFLRFHNYSIYPQRGATSDEYTYAFLGISLWQQHKPISWSSFPEYKNLKNIVIDHINFPIVSPYFDHPFLHGLVSGGWVLLFGQNTFSKITLQILRIEPIILSTISCLFIFLISSKIYNFKTSVWSILIYSTVTIFVMNTRVAVAENLLTTLFLLVIYLFQIFKENMTCKKALILGLICGLSLLTKIVGITIFLSIFYLFINQKLKLKYLFNLCLGFFICVLILLFYANYYDWGLFWAIQKAQGTRSIGPGTFQYILSTPIIVNKIVSDGWYFFGFIAIFFSCFNFNKNKFIVIPAIFYFMILVTTLTEKGQSGWYLIPFFPFMSIAIADFLNFSLEKSQFMSIIFFLYIYLSEIQLLYREWFGLTPFVFRTLLILAFIPLLYFLAIDKKNKFSFLGQIWFYLLIIGNCLSTLNYIHPA